MCCNKPPAAPVQMNSRFALSPIRTTFQHVRNLRWLLPCLLLSWHAKAEDWTLSRFEGRDYVTLNNVAQFYGLPAPAPVTAVPAEGAAQGAPPAPAPATPAPAPAAATGGGEGEIPAASLDP